MDRLTQTTGQNPMKVTRGQLFLLSEMTEDNLMPKPDRALEHLSKAKQQRERHTQRKRDRKKGQTFARNLTHEPSADHFAD